jgi:SRSO17 transposase
MNRTDLRALDSALERYVYNLFAGLGRVERRVSMRWYVAGLLLDGERKSIQPMAARLVDRSADAEAMRQRLQEAVVSANWDDREVRARLATHVGHEIPELEMLVVDDTGFPKKGKKSPGVARQYSGTMGRIDNCQVAVSVHVAGVRGSAALGFRLYLPEAWANDPARRKAAHIPDEVVFQTKWEIALDEIDAVRAAGVPQDIVGADAGYGEVQEFREGLAKRGLRYVVRVPSSPVVWRPGEGPIPPSERPYSRGKGRPPTRHVDGKAKPIAVGGLAQEMGIAGTNSVTWAEGTNGPKTSQFGAVRVRTAHRHEAGRPPGVEEWLLYEWLPDEEPRLWLSNLPADTALTDLVRLAKLRWRIERDYQEMKGECGLDHYEGRTWRGFHHHATLCMVAHAFLAIQRAHFPPEQPPVDPSDGPSATSGRSAPPDWDMHGLRPTSARNHSGVVPGPTTGAPVNNTTEPIR